MGKLFDILQQNADASRDKDWDRVRAFYTDDLEAWSPVYELTGGDAFVDMLRAQNGPFDDIRQETELVAESGNTVVSEWTWTVPHPEGGDRSVTLRGLSYFVFDGDRIAKLHQYFDMAGFVAEFTPEAAARTWGEP